LTCDQLSPVLSMAAFHGDFGPVALPELLYHGSPAPCILPARGALALPAADSRTALGWRERSQSRYYDERYGERLVHLQLAARAASRPPTACKAAHAYEATGDSAAPANQLACAQNRTFASMGGTHRVLFSLVVCADYVRFRSRPHSESKLVTPSGRG
jgi:hypothetical protein